MRVRLTVVDPAPPGGEGPARCDVEVQADPGTRFAQVREALEGAVPGGGSLVSLVADGVPVDDDALLGCAPLLAGAVLRAVRPGVAIPGAPRPSLLEAHVVAGPDAGARVPLPRGRHVVGRDPGHGVRLADPGVSRRHAVIEVGDDGVLVRDLQPTNPSALDGADLDAGGARLEPGARLRLGSTTLAVRRPGGRTAVTSAAPGGVGVHVQPRFTRPGPTPTIAFPETPQRPEGLPLPLLTALAPLVLAAVLALVMRSPAMLLFALMSPVLLLGQWWSDRRRGRRSHRSRVREHEERLAAATEALAGAVADDERARHEEHPDLAALAELVQRRGARLWERRPTDPDHLRVRVGTADQPTRVALEGAEAPAHPTTPAVPVVVDLAAAGVTGIAGPRGRVLAVAGAVLAQVCAWHSPRGCTVTVLAAGGRAGEVWAWASWLPHARPADDGPPDVVDAQHPEVLTSRVAELGRLVAAREAARWTGRPDRVVVLDGASRLREVPGVAELLVAGPAAGVVFVCLDDSVPGLPAEARAVVELDDAVAPHARVTDDEQTVADAVPDLPAPQWCETLARGLAPLQDATPDDGRAALPSRVGFRELYRSLGPDPVVAARLAEAWAASTGSTEVVLGTGAEGPVRVDLRRDGPHVLVGGTTGSGKSELLQTLVAGLAVNNRPDDLGFVLVDYKGGSAFKECARLPHTLGLVTDLDESLTTRALTSLGAELRRRERLLAEAGAKDLDDYRARRLHDPAMPRLGRLVLVVDEFKVLADELPDFVAGLVRVAAVGRSLGIHLVLATQRPAGIVSGDMRANIAMRIALRVRDRADSDDVIEGPEAAGISERTPGRALVRLGPAGLVELQTAHVGGPLVADDAPGPRSSPVVVTRTDPLGLVLGTRWPGSRSAEPGEAAGPRRTELAGVVDAAREAATSLAIGPQPSPWLPPLPDVVPLAHLSPCAHVGTGPVVLGLCDRPDTQEQVELTWDVDDGHLGIAGAARTGRTTSARTLVHGLASRFSPAELHVHVVEGRAGGLADLAALPHVGTVTSSLEPQLVRALVERLLTREPDGAPAPAHTVLVVDGWDAVEDALDEIDHGAGTEDLLRLARDGHAAGVRLVVTGGRPLLSGRLPGLLQRRLVLPVTDPVDLTLAGLDGSHTSVRRVPGRAVDLSSGDSVQLAHVGATPDAADQSAATQTLAASLATAHEAAAPGGRPFRLRPLPAVVEDADLGVATALSGTFLPVGLGSPDLRPVGFDPALGECRVLVVGPSRSGRTTALVSIGRRIAATGRPVVAVECRRGSLAALRGVEGVEVLGPEAADRLVERRRDEPRLALLVDDAEGVDGSPVERAVEEIARLAASADGLCVVTADVRRAGSAFRGVVAEVARDGTGLVLTPTSASDGDVLRVRLEPSRERRAGRGHLVRAGRAVEVQVALPPAG